MQGTEKPYTPKDLTMTLDIGDSTLRKWCLALEEAEYFFSRTENNKRIFFERDIIVLRHFKELVQVQNLSMQNAAMIVAAKFKQVPSVKENTDNTDIVSRSANEMIREMFERIVTLEGRQEQLMDINKRLFNKLEEQQKYIEERMDKRDSLLMESLRESQETKKLLIEAQEEKKKRKGVFSWFSK